MEQHYRILRGIAIFVGLQFLGNLLADTVGMLPGTLYGLLLLLTALVTKLIPVDEVEPASRLLLDNMAAFFVPAASGIMLLGGLLRTQWLPIVGTIVFGTLIVMAITGWTVKLVAKEDEHEQH